MEKTELNSYLIDITADILGYKDSDGQPLVEKILDTAGQKGTGKWTGINALDLGIPLTLISEAVFARCVSSFKEQRLAAAKLFDNKIEAVSGDKKCGLKRCVKHCWHQKSSLMRKALC